MKKFSLLTGLAALAAVGSAFSAYIFGGSIEIDGHLDDTFTINPIVWDTSYPFAFGEMQVGCGFGAFDSFDDISFRFDVDQAKDDEEFAEGVDITLNAYDGEYNVVNPEWFTDDSEEDRKMFGFSVQYFPNEDLEGNVPDSETGGMEYADYIEEVREYMNENPEKFVSRVIAVLEWTVSFDGYDGDETVTDLIMEKFFSTQLVTDTKGVPVEPYEYESLYEYDTDRGLYVSYGGPLDLYVGKDNQNMSSEDRNTPPSPATYVDGWGGWVEAGLYMTDFFGLGSSYRVDTVKDYVEIVNALRCLQFDFNWSFVFLDLNGNTINYGE